MKVESLLQRLHVYLSPKRGTKSRVKREVFSHVNAPYTASEISSVFAPAPGAKQRVWDQIEQSITPSSATILDKVRDMLTPPPDFQLRIKHCVSFIPQTHVAQSRLKWVASLAVVAILINLSPALFLTSKTVAESKVTLIPTQGEVAVSVGGMWQDVTDEIVLEEGMRIRTYGGGQASVIYRDDAVVRLNEETVMAIHSLTEDSDNYMETSANISLIEGDIWLQGMLPASVRGMTVSVPHGFVTVNEGSVSIDENGDSVTVKAWNRNVFVSHQEDAKILMAGEQVKLKEESPLLVKKIPKSEFDEQWPLQNLEKDAVHRRYIAQLQQERRAAAAGILPTSTLYSVKRVAEEVDVLLSLSNESRVQKRLDQANTRLNEAAALLAGGEQSEEVDETLDEFRDTVLKLTSGTGGDIESQLLIKESMEVAMAEVGASMPGDESYALKKAVLEATAEMPDEVANKAEAESALFSDALASLADALESGDASAIQETWLAMQEYLGMMDQEESPLTDQTRKEARFLLAKVAGEVSEMGEEIEGMDPEVMEDILAYLPPQPLIVPLMTEEQLSRLVQSMYDRIYEFKMHKSRENQLRLEINAVSGNREEGRILRTLQDMLPEDSKLYDMVRKQIVRLKWQKAGEAYEKQHQAAGSGDTL